MPSSGRARRARTLTPGTEAPADPLRGCPGPGFAGCPGRFEWRQWPTAMTESLLLLTVFGAACVLCLLLTPLVRAAALRWGLVDEPDGRRKMHGRPIPVAGGVAVLLTTVVVLAGLALTTDSWGSALGERALKFFGLAVAAGVIAAVGVVDDYRGLRGRHKLLGQLLAVGVVIACGVEVRTLGLFGHDYDLGVMAIPFTAFWLLGAINSLNLIDGMDGLLG